MMLEHASTGTGRHDDGVIFGKGFELLSGDGLCFPGKSRIIGWLAAAGLALRKDDFYPFPL
jgi:hypothetical protein